MRKKIKYIAIPFLITTIGFTVLYTFLHWLLCIKTTTLSLSDEVINFGLPFTLPVLVVFIWIRPRVKLLKLTGENNNISLFYLFVAAAAMIVTTIMAQKYLETATGGLTELENIHQIDAHKPTKYYTLKNYHVDKVFIGVNPMFEVSGKHNETLNMYIYIVMPVLGNEADTLTTDCAAWLGLKYSEDIKNNLSDEDKDEKYKVFANICQAKFDHTDVSQFVYLDRVGNSEDGEQYKEAIKANPLYHSEAPVFIAVHEPFENRNGNSFAWIMFAIGISNTIWLLMLIKPKLDEEEVHRFKNGIPSEDDEVKEFIDFMKPKDGFFITPVIVYLNVAIFISMFFSGLGFMSFESEDLLNWGANYRPLTIHGEWWRLLTNTFLHGGCMHVFVNMFGLVFVGVFLEPVLGRIKYLFVYLLAGIMASCASIWWYEATVSVGASGAIFGMYGLFLTLLLTKVYPADFGVAFILSIVVFVGFNLLQGFFGGIDNAAHIGGLLSGAILGLIVSPSLKKQVS